MKHLFPLFISLFILAPAAKAGVFLEPYVGYATGHYEHTVTVAGTTFQRIDQDMTGVGYGGRAGFKVTSLVFGGEYQAGTLNFKGAGGIEPRDLGAFAGLFLPGGIRFWGTYFFKAKTGSVEGKAWKVGLGYLFMKHLAMNVEYMNHTLDKISLPALAGQSVGYSGKVTTLFFSLSVPLWL